MTGKGRGGVFGRQEAEDYVYRSYLAAAPHWRYEDPDSEKRHPELAARVISTLPRVPTCVVTGSKGKGSVCRMLACVMGTRVRTGLMTSPHLARFNERFCVDGRPVGDGELVASVQRLRPAFDEVQRTLRPGECVGPMGIQAAMALDMFWRAGCGFEVLECGKGARYDDVNAVAHEYAVLNTVFLEHTRELGPTLEAIASDKAHVMRAGVRRAFVGPQVPEALERIEGRAARVGVPLRRYGRDFWAGPVSREGARMAFDVRLPQGTLAGVRLSLFGEHQARNCALALAVAADALVETQGMSEAEALEWLGSPDVRRALEGLRIPGRLELAGGEPPCLVDACVNRVSAREVLRALGELLGGSGFGAQALPGGPASVQVPPDGPVLAPQVLPAGKAGAPDIAARPSTPGPAGVTLVMGIPNDKDYLGVARTLAPATARLLLVDPARAHYAFDLDDQRRQLGERGIHGEAAGDVARGIERARGEGLPIVVVGIAPVVADARRALGLA